MPSAHVILLAEDDDQYGFVLQLALKQADISHPVRLVNTRSELVDYMEGQGPYSDRAAYPLPEVIILSLSLPILDDFSALRWIRERAQFNHIKVGVLSSIPLEQEERLARELGADCYHAKPTDFEGLVRAAEEMRRRWLEAPLDRAAA